MEPTCCKGLFRGVVDLQVRPMLVYPVKPDNPSSLIIVGTRPVRVIDLIRVRRGPGVFDISHMSRLQTSLRIVGRAPNAVVFEVWVKWGSVFAGVLLPRRPTPRGSIERRE